MAAGAKAEWLERSIESLALSQLDEFLRHKWFGDFKTFNTAVKCFIITVNG